MRLVCLFDAWVSDGMKRKAVRLAACLSLLSCAAVQASERVALVVGNAGYSHAPSLDNPLNDAKDIAAALTRVGFSVETALDVSQSDFGARFSAFARRTRGAQTALFYYAGHGLQVGGENYLLPVDAELTDETQLGFQAVRLRVVLNGMRSGTNLVFLDACRNNPFADKVAASMGTRSLVGRGLAPVEQRSIRGTFIAYATAAGDIASDGTGLSNSPFTAALKQHIATPGLTIGQVMTRVRGELATLDQEPWSTSSLKADFYFVPPSPTGTKPNPSAPVATAPDPATEMWLQIRERGDVRILERFLNEYPNSRYRLPAEARLAALRQGTPSGKDRLRDCEWCPELVEIPAGQFRMGDLAGEGEANEKPVRSVRVPRFALARHETTVRQFRRFVMATGYRTEAERDGGKGCWTLENPTRNKWDWTPGRSWRSLEYAIEEDQPVVCVSWNDAQAYIEWLNGQTSGGWRLPSEAEWEYAARAGSETLYHFGDDASRLCEYGNVADTTKLPNGNTWNNKAECSDGAAYPTRVGSYRPNALGLHDMHGNVWEWTGDCWNDSYAGAPTDGSAWESGNCSFRVLRGGSWGSYPWILRSANRNRVTTAGRNSVSGFRMARTLTP